MPRRHHRKSTQIKSKRLSAVLLALAVYRLFLDFLSNMTLSAQLKSVFKQAHISMRLLRN